MAKKILVVEDMDDSRYLLKFLLELSGYQVIEAINGQEAVEAVKNTLFDLILMDISMPIMDGITATKIIRQSKDKQRLPIVAVTALSEHYNEAIAAGFNDFITKPIDSEQIATVLEKYIV